MMSVKRYAFDVELLTIASMLNLRMKEMPVKLSIKRHFKFKEIIRMAVDVLGISYRLRIKHYYHHAFLNIRKNATESNAFAIWGDQNEINP